MPRVEVRNLNYATPNRLVDYVDAKLEDLRPRLPKSLGERLLKVNPEVLFWIFYAHLQLLMLCSLCRICPLSCTLSALMQIRGN